MCTYFKQVSCAVDILANIDFWFHEMQDITLVRTPHIPYIDTMLAIML